MSSILLADDNPHAQRMGSQILSQEGHTVITVSDGDEAMQHLEENTPDLVMVDTRMPGPSGFDICKHIKAQPKFSAVKVVLLAGPLEPFDTAEAESAGPDGVLHKPLDAYTLIDTVNSLLGKVPEAPDPGADGATPAAAPEKAGFALAEKKDKAEAPRASAAAPPSPKVPLPAKAREASSAPAATATATKAASTSAAVASRPATAVADLSDALSNHFTAVVEQALGTEDAQQRQRQKVETIVREVLEAALPAIIEEVTNRVMASLEQ